MARREPIRLGPEACADHPAVHAWRSLGGREPRALVVLKEEQWSERRSLAYRLEAAAPEGSVVAKRCPREAAELERSIYVEVLARLPVPALRCHGTAPDADPRWAWIFLAAADGVDFDAESPAHRESAAAWLAAVHASAEALPALASLPERGPEHFLAHLVAGRRRIAESFENPALGEPDREPLDAILRGLDCEEAGFDRVLEVCREGPRTWPRPDREQWNELFATAEFARLANATFWRALDGLAGHVAWGFEKLEACDADFAALAPVLLEESPSRAAPSLEGRP